MKKLLIIIFLNILVITNVFTQSDTTVYDTVEVMPRWIGCENLSENDARNCFWEELSKFVEQRIVYPKYAEETGYQGQLYVRLIVEKDGTVTNHKILRGFGGGTEDEALRLAKQITNLKPGMMKGLPVRVQLTFRVIFILRNNGPNIMIGANNR